MKSKTIQRGDIFIADLEPTIGSEIKKIRPCMIVSSNEINNELPYVVIVPLTTGSFDYFFRIPYTFLGKQAYFILDQIKTIDKTRLLDYKCRVPQPTLEKVLENLQEMFAI
ncbi:MAG: type II toxin-antitoxin system PemK/MazF family toxin [Chitinophagaceae bacterium]